MEISFLTVLHGFIWFLFFLFWMVTFFIFYHLARFGVGLLPKRLAAFSFAGSIAVFVVMMLCYTQVDFSAIKFITLSGI